MKRAFWINVHLAAASLFMPFLLIIPISGGLYLLDQKGEQKKTEAFKLTGEIPEKPDDFFREKFKEQGLDFDFEYIRADGKDYTFRPSSRVHYMATKTDEGAVVYKLEPDLIKRMMEIHKGHGPRFIRVLEIAFALALIFVTISGIYLAVTVPKYRNIMGLCFGLGLAVVIFGLL